MTAAKPKRRKARTWTGTRWAYLRRGDRVWARWDGDHSTPALYEEKDGDLRVVTEFDAIRVRVVITEIVPCAPQRGVGRGRR